MQVVEYFISAAALKLCRLLFFSNGRCEKEGMREFCQRCVPKSSNLCFLSFSAQNCSSYTFFLCDLKQCGSSAYSNKATWWFLIPRQENRIIWLCWKRRASPKGEWTRVWGKGGLMNAMHVWEVVLAGFEINDLDVFSGRESSQRKCADKSSRGAAVTARMVRQKFSFQKKEGQTGNSLVKKRHTWRTPLLIQTWELWA